MRIALLKLKNCLGLKELELKPGKITLLSGKEGQGKSSVLETIQQVFYNKCERNAEFVHTDAERAETYLMLDDGTIVKKYFNKSGKPTTVHVERNGMRPKAAEQYLKELVSEQQLNPISLFGLKEQELSELVLSLIPIRITEQDLKDWVWDMPTEQVDLNKHGLQVCKDIEKHLYHYRTDVNRQVKDLSADVKSIKEQLPENYNADEWRNVSLAEKYETIRKANQINMNRVNCQSQIDNAKTKVEGVKSTRDLRIQQLEDEIRRVKKQADNEIQEISNHVKIAKEYLEKNNAIDITPLEAEHELAEEMKSYIRLADDLSVKEKVLNEKQQKVNNLTAQINTIRSKPQMLLKDAQMPIENLSVNDKGEVLVNSRPIKNLSGGERIKFVMDIVKSTAGPLKIILVDGIQNLSPEGQKQFIDECQNDDFTYVITKTDDGPLQILDVRADGTMIDMETGEFN